MTQDKLIQLASEAKRFENITRHIKVNGQPIKSLKLQLQNDEAHDPLRQKLETRT